jgi:hypothetical protein
MTDLIAGLLLASASFGVVTVAGAVIWCWMNRSRLTNLKISGRQIK